MFSSHYPVFSAQPAVAQSPGPRILLATPCHSGLAPTDYMLSVVETMTSPILHGYSFGLSILNHEAVISRARNILAHQAIVEGYDKLLFIDSDISFTAADVVAILASKKQVVGGTYSLKCLPPSPSFNPLDEHRGDFTSPRRTLEEFDRYTKRRGDPETGEVEVKHVPTGFLAIDVQVLRSLRARVESYRHPDAETGEIVRMHNFFPIGVVGDELLSEDWSFSRLCRESSIPVHLNTRIRLGHIGTYQYLAG